MSSTFFDRAKINFFLSCYDSLNMVIFHVVVKAGPAFGNTWAGEEIHL